MKSNSSMRGCSPSALCQLWSCRTSFASAGLIFSGKTRRDSPKKRVRSRKSFSFQFKEKRRARDMQWLEVDSIIYYIIRAFFEGGIALREAVSA